jgi:5-formyltetrahydrofolate cyclo-ligase
MPFDNEIDLNVFHMHILKENRRLFLPKFVDNMYVMAEVKNIDTDVRPGKFGILEPTEDCLVLSKDERMSVDVWLVPGIAFSKSGIRLGRGGGYYDRLLQDVSGYKIGVGYDFQEVETLEKHAHDVNMDAVFLM